MKERPQIVKSSPEAMQIQSEKVRKSHYPWNELEIGQSFIVKPGTVKKTTLEPYVHRMSNKLNKTFVLKDHGQYGFEVCRQPDRESAVGKQQMHNVDYNDPNADVPTAMQMKHPWSTPIAKPETPSLKWGEHPTEATPISEENARRWGDNK